MSIVTNIAEAKKKVGTVYPKGCTEFVAQALGKPWKKSDEWTKGDLVSAKGAADGIADGQVVGWPGHVCIKISGGFLNCPGPGQAVKENTNMGQALYKYTY